MPTRKTRARADYAQGHKQRERRSDEEIMAEALRLINPPDDECEACRANVASGISSIRQYARKLKDRPQPTARQVKAQLARYLRTLQATKESFVYLPWRYGSKDFLVQLDAEIEQVKADYEAYRVPPGGKRPNLIARAAVQFATELLRPEAYHRPGRDSRPPLTNEGLWQQLSTLFYEAAGNNPDSAQVWTYMRDIKDAKTLPKRRRLTTVQRRCYIRRVAQC